MVNVSIGGIQVNPDDETITSYLEHFELFVSVNNIPDDQQASTLLLLPVSKHYTRVRELVSPK